MHRICNTNNISKNINVLTKRYDMILINWTKIMMSEAKNLAICLTYIYILYSEDTLFGMCPVKFLTIF